MTKPSEEQFRRIYLPYCIERVGDRYVVLNRLYKPLGIRDRANVDYEPHAVGMPDLDANIAATLSWDGSRSTDKLWLYSDQCIPTESPEHWDSYQKRLATLARLSIT